MANGGCVRRDRGGNRGAGFRPFIGSDWEGRAARRPRAREPRRRTSLLSWGRADCRRGAGSRRTRRRRPRETSGCLKRLWDVSIAACALLLLAPLLAAVAVGLWLEDRRSPWYRGIRVGRDGREFRMLKFRSMRVGAAKTGVNSTAAGDSRITRAGRFLRALKLDELPQLWNVLAGEMSLVGPRPQVPEDASLYTSEERRMLEVRPGITDLASIVFSDEGAILAGSADPDLL